jgi:predicted transcriptional regulator
LASLVEKRRLKPQRKVATALKSLALLTYQAAMLTCGNMEIRLPPEQEARLAAIAARDGRNVNDLAQEAITRLLDDDARFAEAVKRGVAAADRGDFVASEDVWSNVERILQS